jgi:hypothetical protein
VPAAVPACVRQAPIMYGPSYGFGSPPADESSPFNHPHQPYHQQQGQQGQEGQQLPQPMMYNPQAYGAAAQQPMYDASGAAVMGGSPEGIEGMVVMTPQQDVGRMASTHLPGGGISGMSVPFSYLSLDPAPLSRHLSPLLRKLFATLLALGAGFDGGLHHLVPSRRSVRPFLCHICQGPPSCFLQTTDIPGTGVQYQTPYTSAPYGVSIPTASSNLPANYFAPSSPGSAAPRPFSMNPQLMNQRIQPPSAPNRASPYGNMQSTPPHATSTHPQFAAAQSQNANPSLPQQGNNPQVGGVVTTPQTPVFPPSQQGQIGQAGTQMATPLSPGSKSRERERVTLLLEINRELLISVIELQNMQQAEKKDEATAAAVSNSTPTEEKEKAEKERAEKAKAASGREYVEYVFVRPLCIGNQC